MSKHTPGPWSIREVSKHGTSVDGFVGVGVAWCGANTTVGNKGAHSISESEAEANARLIAASPTMYSYIAERAAVGDKEAAIILESIHAGR